jgi:hypothetical protein
MRRLRRSVQRSSSTRVRRLVRRTILGPTTGLGLLLASSSALAQAPSQQTTAQDDVPLTPVDVRGQRRGDYRVT